MKLTIYYVSIDDWKDHPFFFGPDIFGGFVGFTEGVSFPSCSAQIVVEMVLCLLTSSCRKWSSAKVCVGFWFQGLLEVHPRRLTWNLKIHPWKRKIIFQFTIFRFYVNLRGCTTSFWERGKKIHLKTSDPVDPPKNPWFHISLAHPAQKCKKNNFRKSVWYERFSESYVFVPMFFLDDKINMMYIYMMYLYIYIIYYIAYIIYHVYILYILIIYIVSNIINLIYPYMMATKWNQANQISLLTPSILHLLKPPTPGAAGGVLKPRRRSALRTVVGMEL